MKIMERIKQRASQELFLPSPLAIFFHPAYVIRRGLFLAIRRMSSSVGGCVLDFGCGSKPYESLFPAATRYVGVDIQASGHDHRNSKVDVYYDGEKLPFDDAYFDAAVCFEVIEHLFDPDAMLAEIRRVLKPDGRFLITVPFAWGEHEMPYDFARYTSVGLVRLLQRNGFEVVEMQKTANWVAAVGQLAIAYVDQHILPRKGLLRRLTQLLVVFPMNLLTVIMSLILPRRHEVFSNCVVVSRTTSSNLRVGS